MLRNIILVYFSDYVKEKKINVCVSFSGGGGEGCHLSSLVACNQLVDIQGFRRPILGSVSDFHFPQANTSLLQGLGLQNITLIVFSLFQEGNVRIIQYNFCQYNYSSPERQYYTGVYDSEISPTY